jgi:hypothetical protein
MIYDWNLMIASTITDFPKPVPLAEHQLAKVRGRSFVSSLSDLKNDLALHAA